MRTAAVKRQCCGSTAQPGAGAPTDSRPSARFLPSGVQVGLGIHVLVEADGRAVADRPRMDPLVAGLPAVVRAARLSDDADSIAGCDHALDVESEVRPRGSQTLEETRDLLGAVRVLAVRQHVRDV